MRNIVLRANDGADHVISVAAASLCKTVASLLQDLEGARFPSLRIAASSQLCQHAGDIHVG